MVPLPWCTKVGYAVSVLIIIAILALVLFVYVPTTTTERTPEYVEVLSAVWGDLDLAEQGARRQLGGRESAPQYTEAGIHVLFLHFTGEYWSRRSGNGVEFLRVQVASLV